MTKKFSTTSLSKSPPNKSSLFSGYVDLNVNIIDPANKKSPTTIEELLATQKEPPSQEQIQNELNNIGRVIDERKANLPAGIFNLARYLLANGISGGKKNTKSSLIKTSEDEARKEVLKSDQSKPSDNKVEEKPLAPGQNHFWFSNSDEIYFAKEINKILMLLTFPQGILYSSLFNLINEIILNDKKNTKSSSIKTSEDEARKEVLKSDQPKPIDNNVGEESLISAQHHFQSQHAEKNTETSKLQAIALISGVCVSLIIVNLIRKRLQADQEEDPYRPADEAEGAVKFFARCIVETYAKFEDLEEDEKQAFLALNDQTAKEIFVKMSDAKDKEEFNDFVDTMLQEEKTVELLKDNFLNIYRFEKSMQVGDKTKNHVYNQILKDSDSRNHIMIPETLKIS